MKKSKDGLLLLLLPVSAGVETRRLEWARRRDIPHYHIA